MSEYAEEFQKLAHKNSFSNKVEVLTGNLCGCFYCISTFLPSDIVDWVDEQNGETAICPNCGIDSVLSSKFPVINHQFLMDMNRFWF